MQQPKVRSALGPLAANELSEACEKIIDAEELTLHMQVPLNVLERRTAAIGRSGQELEKVRSSRAERALLCCTLLTPCPRARVWQKRQRLHESVGREAAKRHRPPTPEQYKHADEWSDDEDQGTGYRIPRCTVAPVAPRAAASQAELQPEAAMRAAAKAPPLGEDNRGYRMLRGMGWAPDQVAAQQQPPMQANRSGLGFAATACADDGGVPPQLATPEPALPCAASPPDSPSAGMSGLDRIVAQIELACARARADSERD